MKKLLYFSADWCGPCRQMSAVISDVFETCDLADRYTLERVDIDAQPEMAARMGIRGIPTMVILDENGAEQSRRVGVMFKNKFQEWLADSFMATVTASSNDDGEHCELKPIKGENKMLTAIKKALGLTQGDETVGSIVEWAGTRLPRNYLPCDGREYPVGQNAYVMLYSIIGTKYGGDGVKTFRVPDLRPRDGKGNLINEQYPWQDTPMKLICWQGIYPSFE